MMKNNLQALLRATYQYPTLEEEDLQKVMALHQVLEVKKGEHILRKGAIAEQYYIVVEGLLRSYVHDAKGDEITTNFYSTNDLVIEVASIFTETPTQENMQALNDCVLLVLSYEEFQALFLSIPAVAEWGRMWMTFSLTQQKERMLNMLTKTAQERYLELMEIHPEIVQNAPLKYIATYLGVTDTSLSRIRKDISK